jgi:hypothetical protein
MEIRGGESPPLPYYLLNLRFSASQIRQPWREWQSLPTIYRGHDGEYETDFVLLDFPF